MAVLPDRPRVVAAALLAALAMGGAARGQVQEEDLTVATPLRRSPEELQARFDAALAAFNSAEQPQSIALWSELIALLDDPAATDEAERRRLLPPSLLRRAEAQFNLGQAAEAESDLARAIALDPRAEPSAAESSPKLIELFRRIRDRTVGALAPSLEPLDAVLEVDGAPLALAPGAALPLLAGPHTVTVRRPGFAPQSLDLEVEAGKATPLAVRLERVSAVVRVTTREPDVEVVVDGQPAGRTGVPAAPAAAAPPEVGEVPAAPPLAALEIEGLEPGDHLLELRKEGFRPAQVRVAVAALTDYELATIELTATRGTLVLRGLPAGARVVVDGVERAPVGDELEVELPVGEHEVLVDAGVVGAFQERFSLADQEVVERAARLVPRLALLGVLGGDAAAAERLVADLATAFADSPHWRLVDHSTAAPAALAELGLDAVRLRQRGSAPPDWRQIQATADRGFTASAYLLAVLSDDLYATEADLLLWAAAPGPAQPETFAVSLDEPAGVAAFVARFGASPGLQRARLGAAPITSSAAGGAVVASVAEDGPAAAAGVRVGDLIVAAGGEAVGSGAELVAAVAARRPGDTLALRVRRAGGEEELAVTLGETPVVLAELASQPAAVLAAWVAVAEHDGAAAAWVVELNRAALFLRLGAWVDAVRLLRGVAAPDGPGLSRAAVDYWLGVALLATDAATYGEQARAALERAAAATDGRFGHHDGAHVAPRARTRLEALAGERPGLP